MVLKGYLFSTAGKSSVVEIQDSDNLQEFYDLLNCNLITIACRRIGNKHYCIVCDDEGLLKDNKVLTATNFEHDHLFGNILVLNEGTNGDFQSLENEDIENIRKNKICYASDVKPWLRDVLKMGGIY